MKVIAVALTHIETTPAIADRSSGGAIQSEDRHYTVGDLVAEFLSHCGVDTAFGIVSVHNVPMLDALYRGGGIRFVMARGELGAAHMADGYARATGRLGVVFTSTGPGVSNAATGIVEARFASTPLLHITGQTITRFADRGMGTVHDIPDQLGLMRAAGKAAYRIYNPADALAVLRQAVADALSFPRGPVTIEVPIDVQSMPLPRPASLDTFEPTAASTRLPTGRELDLLADQVLRARRPMLWMGRGAFEAGEAARELLDLGFAMVTSLAGRGVVSDDHPMNLGALNGGGMPVIEDFYESVDLMLVVGSRLRGYETGDFTAKLPKNLIQIDLDPRADGRTYPNNGFVHGDAVSTLGALIGRVRGKIRVDPGFADDFARLKSTARASFKASLGPYATFSEHLRGNVPDDAVWVRDITINANSWGHRLFQLHDPRSNIYPISGGIGQGLCLAAGAAVGAGSRKTLLMIGDGGLALNLGELWTVMQERLNLLIIVGNDKGYGVIRQIQDKVAGGRRVYDDLLSPDLRELARLAHIPFWRVSQPDGFGDAVREAAVVDGPAMIEIDMIAIGDHPPYFPIGPKVRTVGTEA